MSYGGTTAGGGAGPTALAVEGYWVEVYAPVGGT